MKNNDRIKNIEKDIKEIKHDFKELLNKFNRFSLIYSELNINAQVEYEEKIQERRGWLYNLYRDSSTKKDFAEACLSDGLSTDQIERYYNAFTALLK